MIKTILFDLDGTLADTAQDLCYALNILCDKYHNSSPSEAEVSACVSRGSQAMIKLAFPEVVDDETKLNQMWDEFLSIYGDNIMIHTKLYKDMDIVLDQLEQQQLPWGIVTNKNTYLTKRLLACLKLDKRAACVVCGDTLAVRKPSPQPILHACELINSNPKHTVYIGDSIIDIKAGNQAGTYTLIAGYGYLTDTDEPTQWQADGYVHCPVDIPQAISRL